MLRDSNRDTKRLIFVGPDQDPSIQRVVEQAGGSLTPSIDSAHGVVWLSYDPAELRSYLRPNVGWVQLPSAGVDHWLEAGVIDEQRVWTTAGGAYAAPVAEHALALLLAGARDIHTACRSTAWGEVRPASLQGSTVLIVGSGLIGQSLIRLLEPHGTTILAVNRTGRSNSDASLTYSVDDLHTVLPRADYVVVAAPLTPATHMLFAREEFRHMPDHSWLVNVSRGRLVNTSDLLAALRDGEIRGAALDTTDPEPLPTNHPLWLAPNAIITPHVASPPWLAREYLAGLVAENVKRFIDNRPLRGVIDLRAGY